MQKETEFWNRKRLDEMSREEWESLCDGCAKCCLYKLEDEDTREIWFTNVVCDLLDMEQCRCGDYENRSVRMPNCVTLTPEKAASSTGCRAPAPTASCPKASPCPTGTPSSAATP